MALDARTSFWIQKMHHDDNDALENTSDLCNNLPGWQWHCQKESGSGFSFLAKQKIIFDFFRQNWNTFLNISF